MAAHSLAAGAVNLEGYEGFGYLQVAPLELLPYTLAIVFDENN